MTKVISIDELVLKMVSPMKSHWILIVSGTIQSPYFFIQIKQNTILLLK